MEENSETIHITGSLLSLDDYRTVWPALSDDVTSSVAAGNDPSVLSGSLEDLHSVAPDKRKLAILENFDGTYRTEGNGPQAKRLIDVTLDVAYSNGQPDYLNTTVCAWLRDQSDRTGSPIRILSDTISYNPASIAKVTVDADGSSSSVGGTGGSKGSGNKGSTGGSGGRGSSENSSAGGFISGSGSGGAGRTVQQGEKIDSGAGGTLFGSGGSSGGFQGEEASSSAGDDYDNRSNRSGSGSTRDNEKTLGDLNELAPIPPEPAVFEPGSTYYRGMVTFTVEILDPAADASEEGDN